MIRLVLLLAAAAGLASCSAGSDAGALALPGLRLGEAPRASNVVLIVSDTMRRDRMGYYGGPARTPNFDAFARENLVFEAAYSPAPWTKPSMVTLFTSLYPSQHGLLSHPELDDADGAVAPDPTTEALSPSFTTLAELLQRQGYRTAGFVGNPWLAREFGFAQGFETYRDELADWDVPGEVVSREGLDWLEEVAPERPFFLYLHYMDAHRPYGRLSREEVESERDRLAADARPLTPLIEKAIGRLVVLEDGSSAAEAGLPATLALLERAYDRGVERFDRALGLFLQGFREHPAYADTAIFVVSDHGEALFERLWGNHGGGLYEDETAIPLAARLPGVAAGAEPLATPVSLVDLLPTLFDYLRLEIPESVPVHGRSWLAPVSEAGRLDERPLVVEGVMRLPAHRSIRLGPYKALWQPDALDYDPRRRALFDVVGDPAESRNLLAGAHERPDGMRIYRSLVEGGSEAVAAFRPPDAPSAPLAPEVERRLRALGYLDP